MLARVDSRSCDMLVLSLSPQSWIPHLLRMADLTDHVLPGCRCLEIPEAVHIL